MNILHYFLGFPPYRSGGLTRYACDLMQGQCENGDTVSALWPGQMTHDRKRRIAGRGRTGGIQSYELINPLPVPLDEGIRDIPAFTAPGGTKGFERFLREIRPDAIHFHTLMGLPKELPEAARNLHIRTVFTTHDYFGICPVVTLYRGGAACEDDFSCAACAACNASALSLRRIAAVQSPLYRVLKNSAPVRKLRSIHRSRFFEEEAAGLSDPVLSSAEEAAAYRTLRAWYMDILEHVDVIHFNSTLSEQIYRKYLTPAKAVILPVTHSGIADHRQDIRRDNGPVLRIAMLAPPKPFKGFQVLRKALDELWESGSRNFELRLFSPVQNPSPYMRIRENGFRNEELTDILRETDVLAAPSVWYETFGFTVLEAVSCAVPVIVSDHMGAKDIIGGGGIIVKAGSCEELKDAVMSCTPEKLEQMRKSLLEVPVPEWKAFVEKNYELYH